MAKEETVLQGMNNKLIEIGKCCGMEMNMEKTKVMPSKTGYRRKDKGRDGSDKKTRKKT